MTLDCRPGLGGSGNALCRPDDYPPYPTREERLWRLLERAHERFMRRSNRSIAQFPKDHERLSALATEAARCADALRAAWRAAL